MAVLKKRIPQKARSTKKDFVNKEDILAEIVRSKQRLAADPSLEHNALTRELMGMIITLVENYSRSGKWKSYSYVDEMRSDAVLNLYHKWHRFDETKYDNPFAFYTQIMYHSFLGTLSREKKQQTIKDSVLESQGKMPSFSRQAEYKDVSYKEEGS